MGSVQLGKKLGIRIPLLAFKGCSIDVHHKTTEAMLKVTHILMPEQSAVVRMGTANDSPFTRFTAFGDVDGTNFDQIKERVDTLRKRAQTYFPDDYDI